MGATVAMERSIEFRLLGFYTLWFSGHFDVQDLALFTYGDKVFFFFF